jgi:hypothetical protein
MDDAFLKYRVINSAVFLHAVMLIKSALDSSSALPLRFTATVNEVTETPFGVVFNSGSPVRRPPMITLLKLKFAMLLFSYYS